MINGVLLDENLSAALAPAIQDLDPNTSVRRVGHGMAPRRGSSDPDLLLWIEEQGYVLATDNRRSMPVHLAAHFVAGRHILGILQVPVEYEYGALAEEILLHLSAPLPGELQDRITYLQL